jgi:hypothetical protein
MSITRNRTITVHISPYLGGLAPETHDFVRYLNREAKRLRTGVSFIALANRILAHGNLERALKFANTVGGWLLRRGLDDGFLVHRPQRFMTPWGPITWLPSTIEREEDVLRRGNSGHRWKLRRFEKNHLPFKCDCAICGAHFECRSIKEYVERQGICWGCGFENKIKIAAETLYHLVCAIPQWERDREEIYPADFRYPRIRLWPKDKEPLPGLGLRDYAEPTKLLDKYRRYFSAWRQKAASPVYDTLITPELAAFYLWLLERLPSPERQQLLKHLGRLYKKSCYSSEKGPRTLFDKRAASRPPRINLDPPDAGPDRYPLVLIAKQELQQIRREGGRVLVSIPGLWGEPFWLKSHKRQANLAQTRPAYNEKYGSYLNGAGLSKTLREARSLNIRAIEIRNNMVDNLERDFGPRDQARIASQ